MKLVVLASALVFGGCTVDRRPIYVQPGQKGVWYVEQTTRQGGFQTEQLRFCYEPEAKADFFRCVNEAKGE